MFTVLQVTQSTSLRVKTNVGLDPTIQSRSSQSFMAILEVPSHGYRLQAQRTWEVSLLCGAPA